MSILASCTALALASGAFLVHDIITFRDNMVRALSTQADIVGYNSISPLLFYDATAATRTLSALTTEPHVTAAAVYDREGKLFATYSRADLGSTFQGPAALATASDDYRFDSQYLTVLRRIAFEGEQVGTVYIQSDLEQLARRLQRMVSIGLVVLSLSVLAALLVSSRLQRALSGPIARLVEAARNISQQRDYSVRVRNTDSRDELGQLVETFNEMLSQIQQRDAQQKQSEEEINRLFTLSQDMLCIAGFDGYFKKLNPAWEVVLGFSLEELMSKPYADFLHPEDREVTRSEAGKLAAGQITKAFQNRYQCKDGSYKWLSWNSYPIPAAQLIYGSARDITEHKKAEGQIRDLNVTLEHRVVELDATNRELEAFTYSVSHDLRAPLRRIDGFSQLLMEDYSAALPEDARRYLSRVREGTLHMGNLVDDLLNLARIGRKELNRQVTGLDSVVAEIISEQKRETEGREIEWRIQALPFSDCDPALLKVVMTNLISNAVKYTRPRQRAVIEIGTVEQDGGLVIFVRDNGVGFSMKYADKLFGVFQRLHRVEDFEGTGVGLATVQRIVHKHGGRIWAEAEIDKGATFYFTLAAVAQAQSSTSSESQKEAYAARES
jgi:PAS domain S-box-containing protein